MTTPFLWQKCRQAECKWKMLKLQVNYEALQVALSNFQKAATIAKMKYYSDIKNQNCHKYKAFFLLLTLFLIHMEKVTQYHLP